MDPLRSDFSWWWWAEGAWWWWWWWLLPAAVVVLSVFSEREPRLSDLNLSRAPRSSCRDFRRSSRNMFPLLTLPQPSLGTSLSTCFPSCTNLSSYGKWLRQWCGGAVATKLLKCPTWASDVVRSASPKFMFIKYTHTTNNLNTNTVQSSHFCLVFVT